MSSVSLQNNIPMKRNYGIDTLRIISMFMIVVLHVLGDGGVVNAATGNLVNAGIGTFIEMAVYCAVDCYALISGYVGVSSNYKYSNLATLWIRVVFYSVGITVFFRFFMSAPLNAKGILLTAFPVFTNKYWYFTAYFLLFLLMPLLNSAVNNCNKNRLRITIVVLVAFISFIYPVGQKIIGDDVWYLSDGFSTMWLLVLYLVGGYIRKYGFLKNVKSFWFLLSYLMFSVLTCISIILIRALTIKAFGAPKFDHMFVNYFSFTVFGAGLSLFLFFERVKFGDIMNKIISLVAPLTFSVYLIHKHPLIQDAFIQDKFMWLADCSPVIMVLLVLGISFSIFILCILIDVVRHLLFKALKIKDGLNYLETRIKVMLKRSF